MKLSYLGIDNTYKDGSISAGDYTTDQHLISKIDFATEALRRWAAKYPNDPQLARSYYLGVLVMRKVYTQPEQQTSWEFTQLLVKKYPNTYFGKTAKASMAQGYTEHWYALAEICPTPLPRGVKAQATADPTPSPSPEPGKPYVALITPPCVQPSPARRSRAAVDPLTPADNESPRISRGLFILSGLGSRLELDTDTRVRPALGESDRSGIGVISAVTQEPGL